MKIGIDASFLSPLTTGIDEFIIGFVEEFSKLYGDFIVFTNFPEILNINKKNIIKISSNQKFRFGRKGHFNRIKWNTFKLPNLLKVNKVDILIRPVPEGAIFLPSKSITVVHDLQPLLYPKHHKRMTFYFRYVVPWILYFSDYIICTSYATKKDLFNFYPLIRKKREHIKVIYQGINHKLYNLNVKEELAKKKYNLDKYILSVGHHLPRKNFDKLILAFHKIHKKIPHDLVIAGPADKRFTPIYKELARNLGIEKRVKFLNFVPKKLLPSLYKGADLFILISKREGFGRPPLEAMACGTPVIVSNTGSLPEVTKGASLKANPENIDDVAQKILTLLKNEKMKNNLIKKGLQIVKNYNFKNFAKEIIEIIDLLNIS